MAASYDPEIENLLRGFDLEAYIPHFKAKSVTVAQLTRFSIREYATVGVVHNEDGKKLRQLIDSLKGNPGVMGSMADMACAQA